MLMHACSYAKHEMINNLPGILSIEIIKITDLHSIAVNKFDSKDSAENQEIYINNMKSNPNIKVEIMKVRGLLLLKNHNQSNLHFSIYSWFLESS